MRWFGWFRKKKKAVPVYPLPPAPAGSLLKKPVEHYPKKMVARDFAREREIERKLRQQNDDDDTATLGMITALEELTTVIDSPAPDPPQDQPSFDGPGGGDSGGAGASF